MRNGVLSDLRYQQLEDTSNTNDDRSIIILLHVE